MVLAMVAGSAAVTPRADDNAAIYAYVDDDENTLQLYYSSNNSAITNHSLGMRFQDPRERFTGEWFLSQKDSGYIASLRNGSTYGHTYNIDQNNFEYTAAGGGRFYFWDEGTSNLRAIDAPSGSTEWTQGGERTKGVAYGTFSRPGLSEGPGYIAATSTDGSFPSAQTYYAANGSRIQKINAYNEISGGYVGADDGISCYYDSGAGEIEYYYSYNLTRIDKVSTNSVQSVRMPPNLDSFNGENHPCLATDAGNNQLVVTTLSSGTLQKYTYGISEASDGPYMYSANNNDLATLGGEFNLDDKTTTDFIEGTSTAGGVWELDLGPSPSVDNINTTPSPADVGDTIDVNATVSDGDDNIDSVNLTVREGGNTIVNNIAMNNNTPYFTVSDAFTLDQYNTDYDVEVTAKDANGQTDTSTRTLRVNTDGVNVSDPIIKPSPLEKGDDITVEANVTDPDESNVTSVNLSIRNGSVLADNVSMSDVGGGTYRKATSITVDDGNNYTVRVYAEDGQGDFNSSFNYSFVGNIPPKIKDFSFSPQNWEVGDTIAWSIDASADTTGANISVVRNGSDYVTNASLTDPDGNDVFANSSAFDIDKRGVYYNISMRVTDGNKSDTEEYAQFVEVKFPEISSFEIRGEYGETTAVDVGTGLKAVMFWSMFAATFIVLIGMFRTRDV